MNEEPEFRFSRETGESKRRNYARPKSFQTRDEISKNSLLRISSKREGEREAGKSSWWWNSGVGSIFYGQVFAS